MLSDLHSLIGTSSSQRPGTLSQSPVLQANLVYAFQEILYLYLLTARRLMLLNRASNTIRHAIVIHYERRIDDVIRRLQSARENVRSRLEEAKKDIILLGTSTGETGGFEVASTGPEFLVAMLAANVQRRTFTRSLTQPASALTPLGLLPQMPEERSHKEDVVEMYRRRSAQLHFESLRRPQRRVFLGIRSLEEELLALQALTAAQIDSMRSFRSLLPAPGSVGGGTGGTSGGVEARYIDKQLETLQVRADALKQLQDRAADLRDQVKQAIEILDEDHGKAIRVFTVVTVFFLPL